MAQIIKIWDKLHYHVTCSFYVELVDAEDVKYYTGCIESCGAKRVLTNLRKKRESAFDLDSEISRKISVSKVGINQLCCCQAIYLVCQYFTTSMHPLPLGKVPEPTSHFITALFGVFFGGDESLKLGSILTFLQVYAHSFSLISVIF